MGNRSNIVIRETATQTDNFVILYSHYGGNDNFEAARNVVMRTDRIGDSSYLAAQLFYEFTRLGNYDGTLGYGLWVGDFSSVDTTDNPAVIIDADTGDITYHGNTFLAKVWRREQ
jgi:hypothetical protein